MGLLGIPFPEEEGGAGLDTLAYAIAVEEIARVWGSLGIIVAAHTSLGCGPLHLAGTEEQKQNYLVPMASGPGPRRVRPDRARAPAPTPAARGRRRSSSERHATAASGSSTAASASSPTPARPAPTSSPPGPATREDGSPEISAFIVEQDTPGFSIGRLEEKMGLHASATGELLFEDCRIPADNMLGEQGDGWKIFLKILDGGRISIGAMAVGLAQAALDASVAIRPRAQAVRQADRLASRASRS